MQSSPAPAARPIQSDSSLHKRLRWGNDQVYSHSSREEEEDDSAVTVEDDEAVTADPAQVGTVMAMMSFRGRIGCVLYDSQSQKILFLEDQEDSSAWDLTKLSKSTTV